jgi:hypothetical protein
MQPLLEDYFCRPKTASSTTDQAFKDTSHSTDANGEHSGPSDSKQPGSGPL